MIVMRNKFAILMITCVLSVIGAAVLPQLDYSDKPRPMQGRTLTISYYWRGASPRLLEQNVTSRIEGAVATIPGIEHISSNSQFGYGSIQVELKKSASVAAVKFEISSVIKRLRDNLPENCSYPTLSGGESVGASREESVLILSFQVNADKSEEQIKEILNRRVKPYVQRLENVHHVDVYGGTGEYLELSYRASDLALYGMTSDDLVDAIRNFIGREDAIGEVETAAYAGHHNDRVRIPLYLTTSHKSFNIEEIPVKNINGKIVYLNNLASYSIQKRRPTSYYRLNGMNTIYLNVYAYKDAPLLALSKKVTRIVEAGKAGLHLTTIYDKPHEELKTVATQIKYCLASVVLLLVVVWLMSHRWKYLLLIVISIISSVLLSVIVYKLAEITINPYSLAGITMSLGLVIDSTIVVADHYINRHNMRCFNSVLIAAVTTVSALSVIFWLPREIQHDLNEFAWIIIINMCVSLLVAALLIPALTEYLGLDRLPPPCMMAGRAHRLVVRMANLYFFLLHKWYFRAVVILLFLGGFAWVLHHYVTEVYASSRNSDREKLLVINGEMPTGGTAFELNEKVRKIEAFLSAYKGIKRYETRISNGGSTITVEFDDDVKNTAFPYRLENDVVGKLISIGGADWSTYGVSERGFSNSLNLQHRSYSIRLTGYNFDMLYKLAQDACRRMRTNRRIVDIAIRNEDDQEQQKQIYLDYRPERVEIYEADISKMYRSLKSMLSETEAGRLKTSGRTSVDVVLKPQETSAFDLWQLMHTNIIVDSNLVSLNEISDVFMQESSTTIPRHDQQYVLTVAFNILGSYGYADNVVKAIVAETNSVLPVGFKCEQPTYSWSDAKTQQYWLVGVVVVMIFFVCSIAFESLWKSLVIILLVPTTLTGSLVAYSIAGISFDSGVFAATVLLCGITVNAGIYLMAELDDLARDTRLTVHALVRKAYGHKFKPIFLTTMTTVAGLVPFLFNTEDRGGFWHSFSLGAIAGLIYAFVPVLLLLPALCLRKKKSL